MPHAEHALRDPSIRSYAAAGQSLNQCPVPPHPLHTSNASGSVRDCRRGAFAFFGRSQSLAQCPVWPHRLHTSAGTGSRSLRQTACDAATARRRMCAATTTSHVACGVRRPARNVLALRDSVSSSSWSPSSSSPSRVNGAAPARRSCTKMASLLRSAARWTSGMSSPFGQRMIRSNHVGGSTPSSRIILESLTSPNLGTALRLIPSSRS
mmetsp:Transcript_9382/g.37984  ORF Transcript_9382/g.37984 Transcript_9382/m.37984 type:complete len:209 (+) Transcript_9382:1719-2345(+)